MEAVKKTLFQAKPCTQTAKERPFMSSCIVLRSVIPCLPKKAVFYPNPVLCVFDRVFSIQNAVHPQNPKRMQSVHLPYAFGPPLKSQGFGAEMRSVTSETLCFNPGSTVFKRHHRHKRHKSHDLKVDAPFQLPSPNPPNFP